MVVGRQAYPIEKVTFSEAFRGYVELREGISDIDTCHSTWDCKWLDFFAVQLHLAGQICTMTSVCLKGVPQVHWCPTKCERFGWFPKNLWHLLIFGKHPFLSAYFCATTKNCNIPLSIKSLRDTYIYIYIYIYVYIYTVYICIYTYYIPSYFWKIQRNQAGTLGCNPLQWEGGILQNYHQLMLR